MNMYRYLLAFVLLVAISASTGCENLLNERAYSQLDPETVLDNRGGIESVLISAYGNINWLDKARINEWEGYPADLTFARQGGEERQARIMENWEWDASTTITGGNSADSFINIYSKHYNVIRDVNLILDNIGAVTGMSEEDVEALIAEARFLRAWAYYRLYIYFGPTPLRKSTEDPQEMARATEAEMVEFIETEILEAIPHLPAPGEEQNYGRVTNGGAMGLLTKFYLNTKQWQKAADMAESIIDMEVYELFPVFGDLLKVENEGNSEMMLVNTRHPNAGGGNTQDYINGAFPPGFREWPEKGLAMQDNWANWAVGYRFRDDFYHSFDPEDQRREPLLTEYVNGAGETVDLLNDFSDNIRSFRIWPDQNAQGNHHGNDMPEVRYADILLARAEALNELDGPNPESIQLINQVRNRAGLTGSKEVAVEDFTSKEDLRDHIFEERKWEFYGEGHRRTDLIRQGKFIEQAINRGVTHASEHHRRYPIPQAAIDANLKLKQNDGYY